MPRATDDPLIPLSGGFVVRTSIVTWLIDAGFRLQFRVVDGHLDVSPRAAITPADDRFIRAHRDEILAAVEYVDRQVPA
jgi:hypothetical protein